MFKKKLSGQCNIKINIFTHITQLFQNMLNKLNITINTSNLKISKKIKIKLFTLNSELNKSFTFLYLIRLMQSQ